MSPVDRRGGVAAARSPQGEDHEAGKMLAVEALARSQRNYEGTVRQVERVLAAYLSRCPSPERNTEKLVEALREIKRVAAIEAPPVSDEVPAKVWKLAFDALAEFGSVVPADEK